MPVVHFFVLYHLILLSDFVLFLAFNCIICAPIFRFENEKYCNYTNILRKNNIVYQFIVSLPFSISNDGDKENNLSRFAYTYILYHLLNTMAKKYFYYVEVITVLQKVPYETRHAIRTKKNCLQLIDATIFICGKTLQ